MNDDSSIDDRFRLPTGPREPPRIQQPIVTFLLGIVGLLLAAGLVWRAGWLKSRPADAPGGSGLNVLLISIDTLRADHLGCYGYERDTSPHLDAFAEESVRFEQAISQAPWTTPSHMTLMTSLYPSSHGVNRSFAEIRDMPIGEGPFHVLSPAHLTLAEVLRQRNYETLALTGGSTVAGELGFAQGFDEYLTGYHKLGEPVWRQLLAWLDRDRQRPFFLFFHTFEVHAPYSTRPDFTRDLIGEEDLELMSRAIAAPRENVLQAQRDFLVERDLFRPSVTKALYDGGIRSVDEFLGRLFDELRRRGLYDRTLIVVLSDHGEAFAEHDPDRFYDAHCNTQYEELIRVPLLIRLPGFSGAGRVVTRPVGLIDVAPTVLDLLDVPVPAVWQGRSLETLFRSEIPELAFTVSGATCEGPSVKAWRDDRYKYIATFTVGPGGDRSFIPGPRVKEELYDLLADPGERNDLARLDDELLAQKRRLLYLHFDTLRQWQARVDSVLAEPTPTLEKDLRALGYL